MVVESGNAKEIVVINEVYAYTFENTMMSMDKTKCSMREMRGFRFKSKTEMALWENYFNNALPQTSLIFYCFLEELRFIESEKEKPETTEEIFLYNLRIMIAASVVIYTLNANIVRKKLKSIGDGGIAFGKLIEECEVFISIAKEDVLWANNGEEDIYSKVHELVYLFSSSKFIAGQKEFYTNIKGILWDIEAQGYLNDFFSPYGEVKKKIVGHVKEEEETFKVIFFNDRPVWAKESGENAFYSAIFEKYLRKEDAEFVEFLEKMRIFLMADKPTRKEVCEESVLSVAEKLIIRGRGSNEDESHKEDYGEFAKALFSATSKAEIIDNFALASNNKVIEFSASRIEEIIKDESLSVYAEMEKKECSVQDDEDLKNLFFVNIINNITELYITTTPLLYRDFKEKDIHEMAKLIAENIKEGLRIGKEDRSWL